MPRGDAELIAVPNEILSAELTAINQYFIHAKMCANWGYERLAKKKREESIDEMRDADRLIERILYLGGTPNMQRLFSVRVGSRSSAISSARRRASTGSRASSTRSRRSAGSATSPNSSTTERYASALRRRRTRS
jgi:bacterioferritin (cytochrome b1)